MVHSEHGSVNTPKENDLREPYETPRLRVLGDLCALTLGGSDGIGDSSNTGQQKYDDQRYS